MAYAKGTTKSDGTTVKASNSNSSKRAAARSKSNTSDVAYPSSWSGGNTSSPQDNTWIAYQAGRASALGDMETLMNPNTPIQGTPDWASMGGQIGNETAAQMKARRDYNRSLVLPNRWAADGTQIQNPEPRSMAQVNGDWQRYLNEANRLGWNNTASAARSGQAGNYGWSLNNQPWVSEFVNTYGYYPWEFNPSWAT